MRVKYFLIPTIVGLLLAFFASFLDAQVPSGRNDIPPGLPRSQTGGIPSGRPLPSQVPPGRGAPVPKPLPSQQLAAQGPIQKASENKTSCRLETVRKIDSIDLVEVLLEVNGMVVPQESPGQQKEKIDILAGFRYEERTEEYAFGERPQLSSIRLFEHAGMKRTFRDSTNRSLLDASRKYIIVKFDGKKMVRFSPEGPLQYEQSLLLDELPCDTLLLDQLVPNRLVHLGEEWTVADEVLKAFLGMEAIEKNTLRLVLSAIIDDVAEVDLYLDGGQDAAGKPLPGSLEGASLGGTVSFDLQGKYQFDLKNRRMTWFGIRLEEIRGGNMIEPQLESTALLRIKIAPLTGSEKLTRSIADSLNHTPDSTLLQIVYNGQNGPWRFQHSRQWRMIEDNEKSAALCLLVKGEAVAQCNIMLADKVDNLSMPSLEVYKKELQKGLGEKFGKFVKETEVVDPSKYLVYSVVIDGMLEDIPFRWLYYLLTDPEGNQATVMFEIRADMLELFEGMADEIVQSFKLIPRPDH